MTNSPNDNLSGEGTPQGVPPQNVEAPALPGQTQFTPGRGLSAEYVQAQQAKSKKGKGAIASVLGTIIAIAIAFLVKYGWSNGWFSTSASEAEVQKGIEKVYDRDYNNPSDIGKIADQFHIDVQEVKAFYDTQGKEFAKCVTNKVYDKVSRETRKDLADAEKKFLKKDLPVIEDAEDTCLRELDEKFLDSLVPTREEFRAGIEKMFKDSFNTPDMLTTMVDSGYGTEDQVRAFLENGSSGYADCMTDELYDSASPFTKVLMGQGKDEQARDDMDLVGKASGKCIAQSGVEFGLTF